ncbi:A24 family peptidase [Phenylobacterium sp. LjRoot219]|uniref:A24 family peptidase n=1 Tax=Phenylobacterium sp. LjRoot219 TaxID=3342283 RepID=UPI003ECF52E7
MTPLALLAFNGLLWCAAAIDLRTFRIPNALPLLIALSGLVLHLPSSSGELLDRGAAVLIVGLGGGFLWLRGLFGGGDYKLIWACAVWTGLGGLAPFFLAFGLASGAQGLITLLAASAAPSGQLRNRLRNRVPLAVSIAAAGLYWSLHTSLAAA